MNLTWANEKLKELELLPEPRYKTPKKPLPPRIEYPGLPSEFEVQAEVYSFLKSNGYDIRGEIHVGNPDPHKRGGRLDLVVFANLCGNDHRPVIAIEVKDDVRKMPNQAPKKLEYYAAITNVKQIAFYRNDDIHTLKQQIDEEIEHIKKME